MHFNYFVVFRANTKMFHIFFKRLFASLNFPYNKKLWSFFNFYFLKIVLICNPSNSYITLNWYYKAKTWLTIEIFSDHWLPRSKSFVTVMTRHTLAIFNVYWKRYTCAFWDTLKETAKYDVVDVYGFNS